MSEQSDDNHLNKKDFIFWNRTDYRGFPSKGYRDFFQRPREQLTEYNRKLGSAQFQKSSTDVVRTSWFPGVKGPIKAVSGHKIAPNRFKTTYRSVLTFEEK